MQEGGGAAACSATQRELVYAMLCFKLQIGVLLSLDGCALRMRAQLKKRS